MGKNYAQDIAVKSAMEKMKQARARLVLNHLFFGSAAISLKFEENPNRKTASTDGKHLYFNPEFIQNESISEVEFVVCHEVLHCIMLHPLRKQNRDHKLANMAMDYVINGILKRSGILFDEKRWLYDPKLSAREMSWEMVYEILKKQQGNNPGPTGDPGPGKGKKGDPQDGNGKGQSNGQDQDQDEGEDGDGAAAPGEGEDGPEGDSNGSGDDPGDLKGEGKGNGKGSAPPEKWEMGEVEDAKGDDGGPLSESEKSQLEQDWKITASRALQAAQGCGKAPDGMERILADMIIKKRDLEDVLKDFVVKVLQGDYSYRKPNKRHIIHDIYMPSVEGDSIPEIVMIMDTSGSIGDEQVAYFQAKFNSVMSEFNTKIHVLYVDSKLVDGGEFDQSDLPVVLKPIGGGGTDFRPPFKYMEKEGIEPTCVIYYTDGDCNDFPEPPDFPVLWAIYGREREVPFGEVVNITPEDRL
jgi:predicted metal-dependent peptidase